MRTNAKTLAMRDPAMAALMGAIAVAGSDFGVFGNDFGTDMAGDFGGDFGDDYGMDFGTEARPAHPSHPGHPMHPANQAAMMALWNRHKQGQLATQKAVLKLKPNHGSTVQVEGYSFTINDTIAALGTAQALFLTGTPDTNITPYRVYMNVTLPGFATIDDIKVANVSGTVGVTEDAIKYSPLSVGTRMKLPMLTPSTRATVSGNYTGFLPPGFVGGSQYLFTASFEGAATVAGG